MQKICDWHFSRWAHYEAKLNKDFCNELIAEFGDLRSKKDEHTN